MNIVYEKVNVVLREDLYGNIPFDYEKQIYRFCFLDGNKMDLITNRNEKELIAVTAQQQKSWQGRKIIRMPVTLENGPIV